VTKITKDIQAIDYWLSEFENSLNEIKDKLAFIRRNITTFIHNTGLLDIEFE